jgi:hypothetical protein
MVSRMGRVWRLAKSVENTENVEGGTCFERESGCALSVEGRR